MTNQPRMPVDEEVPKEGITQIVAIKSSGECFRFQWSIWRVHVLAKGRMVDRGKHS